MFLSLMALVSLTAVCVWGSQQQRFILLNDFICPLFSVIGLLGLIACSVISFEYTASRHRANIINVEYDKNYTQEEVFYASNVIDTIRQLDRKRIELNGDLMRECK